MNVCLCVKDMLDYGTLHTMALTNKTRIKTNVRKYTKGS